MADTPLDMTAIFNRGAVVLKTQYILAAPTVISVFFVWFLSLSVIKHDEDFTGIIIMGAISMVAGLYAHGVTLGMAHEALNKGATSVNTMGALALRLMPDLLPASVAISAAVLAGSYLLLLPGIAAGLFLMFSLPAIVINGLGVVDSFKLSIAIVKRNLRDSAWIFLAITSMSLLMGLINILLGTIPVVGQGTGVILSGMFGAVASVILVQVYAALLGRMTSSASGGGQDEPGAGDSGDSGQG